MASNIARFCAGFCALALAACNGGEAEDGHDILDAAEIFANHQGTLATIRAAYPGPYTDFERIPARNPADDDAMDRAFLKILREEMPVEFIDFFPIGDSGKDEIDVVLWRELDGDRWRTVSLIWFGMPMTLAEDRAGGMRAFETCGPEVKAWLAGHDGEPVAAFCKLNDHWQAYQRVE
ncbi:MAG: hypothetical protein R3C58_10575 [Parvularculaceae bacterium]